MSLIGILFFIVSLGIIIIVHEFGHLIAAKIFGVYCYEFSIGMGPKLITMFQDKSGTKYNLRLIPIGGFVQLAGEEVAQDAVIINDNQLLQSKAWWKQLIIMLAGTINNVLLCLIILLIMNITTQTPIELGLVQGSEFITQVQAGWVNFIALNKQMIDSLIFLFTSQDGINQLSGIVGIADVANQATNMGIGVELYFVALISLNIGIMNQLPLPMLDGGQILLMLYTKIFKRPVNKTVENILMYGSMAILILLFVYTTVADVRRLGI